MMKWYCTLPPMFGDYPLILMELQMQLGNKINDSSIYL